MIFRTSLFFKEALLFGLTLILSIFLGHNYIPGLSAGNIETISFSWSNAAFFIIFFAVITLLFLKFKTLNRVTLRFVLILVVFSGSHALYSTLTVFPWSFVLAVVSVIIFNSFRNVFIHDLAMVVGLAGVSGVLGLSIVPETGIVLLVLLSFYDILAVYSTRHMVYLAKGMVESGAIFGFIIPFRLADAFSNNEEVNSGLGDKFMILGSGDIGLPAIVVSSVAVVSVEHALVVGLFTIFGLFATHLIFINQRQNRPMAALPPIATFTIIGYLVSRLL